MEKHTVSKLIGSPPGYVGYDEGGQLTEKVRRKPYSVILFDEIEKADEDVFNIMLQIMDDGVLTDSQGRKVDFKNTIIVMTSNIGARNITDRQKKLGFAGADEGNGVKSVEEIRELVMKDLRNTFKPEFLNRIDDIIVFSQLTREDIHQIASHMDAETMRDFVNDIESEAERLQRTTEKLLSLSRIDSGASLTRERVDLRKVAEKTLRLLHPLAKENRVTIATELQKDCFVWGNEDLLYRVIFNLAENAVKYNMSRREQEMIAFCSAWTLRHSS